MSNYVDYYGDKIQSQYNTADTSADPSDTIWHDWVETPDQYYYFRSRAGGGMPGSTIGTGTAGTTVTTDTDGSVLLSCTTDNEAPAIHGANVFQLAADKPDVWFEARIKIANITANRAAFLLGFTDQAPGDTVPINSGGGLQGNNVGFHYTEADTNKCDASYRADGVNAVAVKADVATLAADTYIKLGMRVKGGVLTYYVNGVADSATKTLPVSTDGTDFPADVAMKWIFQCGNKAANDYTSNVDWIRVSQASA